MFRITRKNFILFIIQINYSGFCIYWVMIEFFMGILCAKTHYQEIIEWARLNRL